MLARTVSGVFDKLKSLPNLPQEMMSGIRGRDCPVERKESTGVETDIDSISVDTVFAPDMVSVCFFVFSSEMLLCRHFHVWLLFLCCFQKGNFARTNCHSVLSFLSDHWHCGSRISLIFFCFPLSFALLFLLFDRRYSLDWCFLFDRR